MLAVIEGACCEIALLPHARSRRMSMRCAIRADTPQSQGFANEAQAKLLRDGGPPPINRPVREFFDAATHDANQMIVHLASIQLVEAVMLPEWHIRDEACPHQLIEHAIGGRKVHPLALPGNLAVNLLGAEMSVLRLLQIVEDGNLRGRAQQAGSLERVKCVYR